MKKVLLALILFIAGANAQSVDEEPPLNEDPLLRQVSDHCYVLHMEETGENIAMVATMQGTLLFDPPPEPDLTVFRKFFEELPVGPVRWMVNTGNYFFQTAGVEYFLKQGAVLLAGFRQYAPPANPEIPDSGTMDMPGLEFPREPEESTISSYDRIDEMPAYPDIFSSGSPVSPRYTFKGRMYLYPDNLEIQIRALPHEARTAADIFAYVPDEKVLFTGRLYEPSYYPDIDVSAGGSALRWIDALEETIDSVPLLISAIPPEEPEEEEEVVGEEGGPPEEGEIMGGEAPEEGEEEEEITLEEMIIVVAARGEVSNLMMMKELLGTARKLQRGISRAVKSGRSCEEYLDSPDAYPYQTYGNYFPYATQLCKELSPEPAPTDF